MVMDADGSHKAEDAAKVWAAREDADLVVGSRMVKGGGSDGSAFRRGLSRIIAAMFAWFARLPARTSAQRLSIVPARAVQRRQTSSEVL